MAARTKVYELAKEIGLSNQQLLDVIQVLGIDIKSPTSAIGTEEVRLIRKHCETMPTLVPSPKKKTAASTVRAAKPAEKATVSEKRVGSTVIRRRRVAKPKAPEAPAPEAKAPAPQQEAPVKTSTAASKPASVEGDLKQAAEEKTVVASAAVPDSAQSVSEDKNLPTKEAAKEGQSEDKPKEAVKAPASSVPRPKKTVEVSPQAPAPRQRRPFPSIIKRVKTEDHLDEAIGKIPDKVRVAREKSDDDSRSPRKVKEISINSVEAAEPVKDVNKRRLLNNRQRVFRNSDFIKRELVRNAKKKKTGFNRPGLKTQITQPAAHKRVVEMGDEISVADLAQGLSTKSAEVLKKLLEMGAEVESLHSVIDLDTATLIAAEYGFEVNQKVFREEDYLPEESDSKGKMVTRPAVVTVMGHVDHGKTSLLDTIRKSQVADGEKGGITQHIGAYTVVLDGKKLSFIDTPGHEAFTEMRARGASVTDVVILVVSAADGVMPQTLESIAHAKAAGVPIVVAVNKIDLPDANPEKTRQTLAGHELTPEEWGGDTIFVNVSAKTGEGVKTLLESVILQSEMLELKAVEDGYAQGVVIESKLDKGRGPLATVLVQQGNLKQGDFVVCGKGFGKVRAMNDHMGKKMKVAGPSDPVEILGMNEVPLAGDKLFQVKDERTGKELIEKRMNLEKLKAQDSKKKMTLEEMLSGDDTTTKELRLIVKSDVQGSFEAIRVALTKLPQDKVKVKILHSATGGVTESDVMLASASEAAIVGFNVRPDSKAAKAAAKENVEIRSYGIIYELVDEVKGLMQGLLDKVVQEKVIGRAHVKDVFKIPKIGAIAGSSIIDGKITRNCYLRLLRESRLVYEGKISSLRRFKDDVKEVAQGMECGIGLENFNDLKTGDELEAYLKEEIEGSL